jgi:hypothetical protein
MKRLMNALALTLFLAPLAGHAESLIQVQKGDRLKLEYSMTGDLLETSQPSLIEFEAKQNMWIRMSGQTIEASLDNVTFKPIPQFATGTVEVGVTSGAQAQFNVHLTLNSK